MTKILVRLSTTGSRDMDALVAVHVAKWTDIRHEEGEDVNIEAREIYPWAGIRGAINGERKFVPFYSSNTDLLFDLVGDRQLELTRHYSTSAGWHWTAQLTGENMCEEAGAETPQRALCVVLLRAAGLEVVYE